MNGSTYTVQSLVREVRTRWRRKVLLQGIALTVSAVLLAALVEAVNATWEHRDELTAVTHARRRPRPLDIYALLPQTNCKQCGEATCMAFAFGFIQQNRTITECPTLAQDPAFTDRRATLSAML